MLVLLWCVLLRVEKRGKTNEKEAKHTCTPLFVGLAWLLVKNGVSAFFVVVVL